MSKTNTSTETVAKDNDTSILTSEVLANKFNQDQWNAIEKTVSQFELQVIEALVQTGVSFAKGETNKSYVKSSQKLCLGTEFDSELIKTMIDMGIFNKINYNINIKEDIAEKKSKKPKWNGNKNKNDNKKSTSTKVEQIRRENANIKTSSAIKEIVSSFDKNRLNPKLGFTSNIIELIGSTFCYVLKYMIQNKIKFESDKYYDPVMSIIVSSQRFLNTCSDYVGLDMITPGKECKISQKFIAHMKECCDMFYRTYVFDGMKICRELPALLVRSIYDTHIPKLGVSPYDHQVQLLETLHQNMNSTEYDALLCVYSAMIGSGKTTSVLSLASYIQYMRAKSTKYTKLQLLFICNLESVKTQEANLCYNATTKSGYCKFGVGYTTNDGTYRIVNHFSTNDDDRIVIICDPGTAYKILSDRSKDAEFGPVEDRFVKFHDEHTIGGDQEGSIYLRQNVECMMTPTRWTILSSATSPKIEDLPKVIEHTKKVINSNNLQITTIHSNSIFIGIDVMNRKSQSVTPFQKCKTGSSLKKVISQINNIPFLGRMLTSKVAVSLYENIKLLSEEPSNKIDFKTFPDIPTRFQNVDNMKADSVKSTVIEMLDFISNLDDSIVEIVCSHDSNTLMEGKGKTISKSESESESESDEGFCFEQDDNNDDNNDNNDNDNSTNNNLNPDYDYKTLGTTGAHRFNVQTLIAVNNPISWSLEHFAPLLDELSDNGVKYFSRLLDSYNRRRKEFDYKIEKLTRNTDNEDALSQKIQEAEESAPTLEFCSFGQINTAEHIKKFGEGKEYDNVRLPLYMDAYIKRLGSMQVRDELLILLMCGVGVYEPLSKDVDKTYLTLVLELAAEGKLAYMVADNSITFGTNYPFGKIVVCEDFSNTHSIYTLFQLLGRAGRVGMSWKAEAMISDSMVDKLVDFTINPEKYTVEIQNIDSMIRLIKKEKDELTQREMEALEREVLRSMEPDKPTVSAKDLVFIVNTKDKIENKTDKIVLDNRKEFASATDLKNDRIIRLDDSGDSNSKDKYTKDKYNKDLDTSKNQIQWNRKNNSSDSTNNSTNNPMNNAMNNSNQTENKPVFKQNQEIKGKYVPPAARRNNNEKSDDSINNRPYDNHHNRFDRKQNTESVDDRSKRPAWNSAQKTNKNFKQSETDNSNEKWRRK